MPNKTTINLFFLNLKRVISLKTLLESIIPEKSSFILFIATFFFIVLFITSNTLPYEPDPNT